jgi:uncharacterized membrane protein YecN with MAPEG domain
VREPPGASNLIPHQTPEAELSPAMARGIYATYLIEPAAGLLAAWLIFTYGATAVYRSRLALIAEYDLGYLFLAIILLRIAHDAMVLHGFWWRVRVQISRPSQYVYKVFGKGGDPRPAAEDQFVLMTDEGSYGAFNRAMRAVANFEQYLPIQIAMTVAAGFVFSLPVLIVTAVAVVGRLLYMVGYARRVAGRRTGYVLAHIVPTSVLYGLMILTVLETS